LAYAVRCVLAGLVLPAVATVACAQMCEAAEGMAGPEMPFRMRAVASACAWSEVQVYAQWRCYAALCADVRRFVDMPRLLPAEYESPAGALVLGSKTIRRRDLIAPVCVPGEGHRALERKHCGDAMLRFRLRVCRSLLAGGAIGLMTLQNAREAPRDA
ncbi:hypothetical protein T492DRAFT_858956, partial [Pavlovales sp. CCMP2436]